MTNNDIKILEIAVNQFITTNNIRDFDELQDCLKNAIKIDFVNILDDIPVQHILDIFFDHYDNLKQFTVESGTKNIDLSCNNVEHFIIVYDKSNSKCDHSVEMTISRRNDSIFIGIPIDIEASVDDEKIVSIYTDMSLDMFEISVPHRSSDRELEVSGLLHLYYKMGLNNS